MTNDHYGILRVSFSGPSDVCGDRESSQMALINPVIEQRAAQVLQVLSRHMKVRAGYIFGSHVDGTPDAYSDIDLGVFVEGIEAWDGELITRTAKHESKQKDKREKGKGWTLC